MNIDQLIKKFPNEISFIICRGFIKIHVNFENDNVTGLMVLIDRHFRGESIRKIESMGFYIEEIETSENETSIHFIYGTNLLKTNKPFLLLR